MTFLNCLFFLGFFGGVVFVEGFGRQQSVEVYGKLQCCHLQEETTPLSESAMKCVNVTVAKIKLKDYYNFWFDSTLQEIHVEQSDRYNLVYKGNKITTIKPYIEAYIECPFGAFDKSSEVLENRGMIKYDIVAGNC